MSKKITTSNARKGGTFEGKPHYNKDGSPAGGIKIVIGDSQRPAEVEGGEVIINKHAAKKHWRTLSKINQSAGDGVPITEPKFKSGSGVAENLTQAKSIIAEQHSLDIKDIRTAGHSDKYKQYMGADSQKIITFYNRSNNHYLGSWGEGTKKLHIIFEYGAELKKGQKEEREHLRTLEKVYEREITPLQGTKEVAKDHLSKDKQYYKKLALVEKFAKGGKAKVAIVMREFKEGNLYTSYGEKVTDRNQALAIALSEAGLSKHEKGANTDSKVIQKWSEVPDSFKYFRPVKKLRITDYTPKSEVVEILSDMFAGKDDLRPVMTGAYFDKNGITITDAHRLVYMNQRHKFSGSYACSRYALRKISHNKKDRKIETDSKYPNYEAIIPMSMGSISSQIDVKEFYSYVQSCKSYVNDVTNEIDFTFGKEMRIAINRNFLIEICKAFLMLGHEKVYASFSSPNRGVVFSPYLDIVKSPSSALKERNSMFIMVMPIFQNQGDTRLGAYKSDDADSEGLSVYFDFKDGKIHSADESEESQSEVPFLGKKAERELMKLAWMMFVETEGDEQEQWKKLITNRSQLLS